MIELQKSIKEQAELLADLFQAINTAAYCSDEIESALKNSIDITERPVNSVKDVVQTMDEITKQVTRVAQRSEEQTVSVDESAKLAKQMLDSTSAISQSIMDAAEKNAHPERRL